MKFLITRVQTHFCIEIPQAKGRGITYFGVVTCSPEWHGVNFLVKFFEWFEVDNESNVHCREKRI